MESAIFAKYAYKENDCYDEVAKIYGEKFGKLPTGTDKTTRYLKMLHGLDRIDMKERCGA